MTVSGAPAAPSRLDAPAAPRRRVVLWVSATVGVVLAAMVAVFASIGKPSDTSTLLGGPAPALAGTTLTGHRHLSLTSFAGKWLLVDFSASWCVDCREELPQLKEFARTAKHYDAAVLTVEEDPSDAPAMARWLAAEGAHWPAIQDPAATATFGVTGIPTVYLVDPVGIIVGYYPSGISPTSLDSLITSAIRGSGGNGGSGA